MSTHCAKLRICGHNFTVNGPCNHVHVSEPGTQSPSLRVLISIRTGWEQEVAEWLRTMPSDDLCQIEALADGVLEGRYRNESTMPTTRVMSMVCGVCVFSRERDQKLHGSARHVVCQACASTGTVKVALPGYTAFGHEVEPNKSIPPPRRMRCGCDEGKHPKGTNYLAGAADRDGFTCSDGWPR